jgi:hypothetical protein
MITLTWPGADRIKKIDSPARCEKRAYPAAALTDFFSVGSLISSLRVGAANFGAGIVISSTPLANVAAAFSVLAPSGRGI